MAAIVNKLTNQAKALKGDSFTGSSPGKPQGSMTEATVPRLPSNDLRPSSGGSQLTRSTAFNEFTARDTVPGTRSPISPGRARSIHWVQDKYVLCCKIRRILDLPCLDTFDSHFSAAPPDPYVCIALLNESFPRSQVSFKTRTIFKNRNPVYEETFFMPLSDQPLDENNCLVVTVYDYDTIRHNMIGSMQYRLSLLLGYIDTPGKPMIERYQLQSASGELMSCAVELEFTVMNAVEGKEAAAKHPSPPHSLDALVTRCGDKTLELHVQGIKGLRTRLGEEEVKRGLKDLKLELRVGSGLVRVPVTEDMALTVENPNSVCPTMQLKLDKKLVVPLKEALTSRSERVLSNFVNHNRLAAELGDVRLFVMSGSTLVCKAQWPLWAIPQAPAGPPTEGQEQAEPKLLSTPMERYSDKLISKLELDYTIRLVNTSSGGDSSGPVQAVGAEDEEDMHGAAPLAADLVPPPLATSLIDEQLGCGPCRLFQLLVGANSPVMKGIYDAAKLTDIVAGTWSADNKRVVTYNKPLNIPFAPKQAKINEEFKLLSKEAGGWVMELRITTNAPKGDCFEVVVQMVANRGREPNTCSLRVSMTVNFVKPPGMLRGVIENGASKDSAAQWQAMVAAVKANISAGGAGGVVAGAGAGAAPQALGTVGPSVPAGGRQLAFGGFDLPGVLLPVGIACAALLLVLLLVIKLARLSHHVGELSSQVKQLMELHQAATGAVHETATAALKVCHVIANKSLASATKDEL